MNQAVTDVLLRPDAVGAQWRAPIAMAMWQLEERQKAWPCVNVVDPAHPTPDESAKLDEWFLDELRTFFAAVKLEYVDTEHYLGIPSSSVWAYVPQTDDYFLFPRICFSNELDDMYTAIINNDKLSLASLEEELDVLDSLAISTFIHEVGHALPRYKGIPGSSSISLFTPPSSRGLRTRYGNDEMGEGGEQLDKVGMGGASLLEARLTENEGPRHSLISRLEIPSISHSVWLAANPITLRSLVNAVALQKGRVHIFDDPRPHASDPEDIIELENRRLRSTAALTFPYGLPPDSPPRNKTTHVVRPSTTPSPAPSAIPRTPTRATSHASLAALLPKNPNAIEPNLFHQPKPPAILTYADYVDVAGLEGQAREEAIARAFAEGKDVLLGVRLWNDQPARIAPLLQAETAAGTEAEAGET